jgi:hypothetical protein
VNASLNTPTITFGTNSPADISVTLTPGNNQLVSIKNGNTTLIRGTHYTVAGNVVTVKEEYLLTLAAGRHNLTFDMSGGIDPVLTVTVEDNSLPMALWSNPFTDVDPSAWYYGDVEFAYKAGLFAGTSATAFSPAMPMTRGMLATVLHRLAGSPAARPDAAFGDVAEGNWYYGAVNWAAQSGIVNGVGGGLFAPDHNITREQMAVMLYNYANFMDRDLPRKRSGMFADEADISAWAKEAVNALYAASILSGRPGELFDPQGQATRAEVAAMLHRFILAFD